MGQFFAKLRQADGEMSPERRFRWATAGLLAFGILGQILCELLGYDAGLLEYLGNVLLCLGLGGVVYGIFFFLRRNHWLCKVVVIGLSIMALLWNLMLCPALGIMITFEENRKVEYVDLNDVLYADKAQVSLELLDACHLLGRGEPFYRYPDMEESDIFSWEDRDLYSRSLRERNRAEAVFGDYRASAMVPVLSYCYGSWVLIVYLFAAGTWLTAAGAVILALKGWWRKLLFAGWGLFLAMMVFYSALAPLGLLPLVLPPLFSGNTEANLMLIAPPLAVMLALADGWMEKGRGK